MITVTNVVKKFDATVALNNLSCNIPPGCIYGLVGSNGAGKSTLLRLINGVYRQDAGEICLDGKPVFNDPDVKERFLFIPDELYFLPQANLRRMAMFYAANYRNFDWPRFNELCERFRLDKNANLNSFSKGMRRQAAVILALSSCPDFLFMDETFDGLDPVMRNLVRSVLYMDIQQRGASAVITSHSLRELEDTCDQLALLHKGGLLFESDVANLKTSLHKVQIAFSEPFDGHRFDGLQVLACRQTGSVAILILKGDRAENEAALRGMDPLLLEMLPLTLEEVFLHEMQALGYSFETESA